MKNGKLSLFFALFLAFCWTNILLGQPSSLLGIALSEYCVTNTSAGNAPNPDAFGNLSDWVELKSNSTVSVNMNGYYLSDDPLNLYKWPFPSNFTMGPGTYRTIFLSGKNTVVSTPNGPEHHANFSIDQCKRRKLILSNNGNIRDSVAVIRMQEGHSRARVGYTAAGNGAGEWRIFPTNSFGVQNVGVNYRFYAPTPIIRTTLAPVITTYTGTSAGGFYSLGAQGGAQNFYIYLENGIPYDSTNTCFRVYYTIDNGELPVPATFATPMGANTKKLMDTAVIIANTPATIIRAVSVPKFDNTGVPTGCELDYLPSFVETNTFFSSDAYSAFHKDFGVLSYAMDWQDTTWFSGNGAAKKIIHVEYYDKKQQVCEGYTQIDRPVNEQWMTKQKGFNMTIDDRRGFGCNFEGPIFNVDSLGASDRKVFPTLHLKAGDYESHSQPVGGGVALGTAILDVFYQSLAAKNNLNVNPLHIKPVIVFKNGVYQGVYDLRETYDKHYENYYNQQSLDSLDMMYHHMGTDGALTYFDGPPSNFSSGPGYVSANSFVNTVYTLGISQTINTPVNYNKLFSRLDKASFIDYMILNSYAMNSNLWLHNIAYARGGEASKPGNKWHYYLWNMPSIFNFTALSLPGSAFYPDVNISPCDLYTTRMPATITAAAGNSHAKILENLMRNQSNSVGSPRWQFQLEYKNRYQDLLNGPLKCENLLKHWDYVKQLFLKEMTYMEDPASIPVPGPYTALTPGEWDTNTVVIRRGIEKRCERMKEAFGVVGCYGLRGPYPLTVDVEPAGAGKVKLNSLLLNNYVWSGDYFATILSLKAIPADETYIFDHWEFQNHTPMNSRPISLDSVAISFAQPGDNIVAVFTDKKNDIAMPSGFTPNGDGVNDVFKPVGSAKYTHEFDLSIWNRWGQEVFRSTDPTTGWDGSYRGELALTGVYAYVITYKNMFNESKILKGNITLLR
jgi:gliding motility-associated-like protein